MKVRFSCLPGYEDIVPRPCLAAGALPGWVKEMPAKAQSDILGGAEVRTVKQCPPFLDAMQAGILFPLAADLTFENGEFSWDWGLPAHPASRATRSPIGVHVPEQAAGVPGIEPGRFAVKFNNFWTIELPEGWSMLFSHPANWLDLPFRTLTGLVDADRWRDGMVHFPALWTDIDFSGTLAAGTPVAQGWPVPREALDLDFAPMDDEALSRHTALQDGLQDEPGLYRKSYRAKRV
ncbi:hypothetical protein [Oricola nitratireducens]|uniref:hypothetical protein n=1 Tax=Oricola nitratireducens TaxID=2775868 RepID=UPI001868D1CF|nr:hypothetical protein [Oricola nitratireducens]